jgi:arginine decarboxylase
MFKQLLKNAVAPKNKNEEAQSVKFQIRGTQDLHAESGRFQNAEVKCLELPTVKVKGVDISNIETQRLEIHNPEALIVGNRIPKDYFVTKGTGHSDIAIHAGSYHLALKQAGIEMANIITYSSILPKIANRVDYPEHIEHGAVMETIMSVCNAEKGQRATAGITYGWLYDKITGEKYGGLVCEHQGNQSEEELQQSLGDSLEELYVNGFDDRFDLRDITVLLESFVPEKKYGTALVALCFTSYHYPILGRQ